MNWRIKHLAEQAGLEFDDDLALEPEPIYYTTQKDLEKFAELIVQKCADIGQQYADGNYEVYNQILEYFGVEE